MRFKKDVPFENNIITIPLQVSKDAASAEGGSSPRCFGLRWGGIKWVSVRSRVVPCMVGEPCVCGPTSGTALNTVAILHVKAAALKLLV